MSLHTRPLAAFAVVRTLVLALTALLHNCCLTAFSFQSSDNTIARGESKDSGNSVRKTKVHLFGRVTDSDGKEGVASQLQVFSPKSSSDTTTFTDANGRFELSFEVESSELINVVLKAVSHDHTKINYVSPCIDSEFIRQGKCQLDITLHQQRDIVIEVVDENQFAVENGFVCVFQSPYISLGAFPTGQDGIVRVTIPDTEAPWTIAAVKKEVGFLSLQLPSDQPDGPQMPVKVVLEKAQPMRVQINDIEKISVVGAQVRVLSFRSVARAFQVPIRVPGERVPGELIDLVSEETDDSGEAWLDALPFGSVTLSCLHPDYEAYSVTLNHEKGPEFVHKISLRNVATNRCLVVDEFGKPLVDANIEVEISPLQIFKNRIPNRTDSNGMIEFSTVVGKPYMITARMGGLGATAITGFGVKQQESKELQALQLKPLRTITGTVRIEGNGKPVVNRTVYLSQLGAGLDEVRKMRGSESVAVWVRPIMSHRSSTDAEGRFRFVVPEGEYNISLFPQENNSKRFRLTAEDLQSFDLKVNENP